MRTKAVLTLTFLCALTSLGSRAEAQVVLKVSAAPECARAIDGFGTTAPPKLAGEHWVHQLYLEDLGASLLRVDLTPRFRPPVSNVAYLSPWFHGHPALPGPEGNNVRSYRDLADYGRAWDGRHAPIVVMGPDAERNLALFDFGDAQLAEIGNLASDGQRRGEFKVVGTIWSPAPWLKHSSGNRFQGEGDVMPAKGTPFPFIWAGNFAGGVLDTSDEPRAELDDGTGPTSALTQFARITAAFVLGWQRRSGARLYALSLQNELNFETFYNSCSYPRAEGYLAALSAVRGEFDRHPELRSILLFGPEDLIESDPYALWQYGQGASTVHKNLQLLERLERAQAPLSFFAVHAYARDGVHGSGADAQMWKWWLDGWSAAPAPGLPAQVRGARSYHKKTWMTESSGERSVWSAPDAQTLVERNDTALGLAIKMHQALTVGEQSAWLYWHLLDGNQVKGETLTDPGLRAHAPKYVAFKHFARFIRPGACVAAVEGHPRHELLVSAYRHPNQTTVVLINPGVAPQEVRFRELGGRTIELYTSDASALWQRRVLPSDHVWFSMPAQSVATLVSHEARVVRAQDARK